MALLQLPVLGKVLWGHDHQLLLSLDSVMGPGPVLCAHTAVLNKDPLHYPYEQAQASIFMKTLGREKILMASSTCTSFRSSSAR